MKSGQMIPFAKGDKVWLVRLAPGNADVEQATIEEFLFEGGEPAARVRRRKGGHPRVIDRPIARLHATREAAIAEAVTGLRRHIASLENQIASLEGRLPAEGGAK